MARKDDRWLQPSLLDLVPARPASAPVEQTRIEYDAPRRKRVIDPSETSSPPPTTSPSPSRDPDELPWLKRLTDDDTSSTDPPKPPPRPTSTAGARWRLLVEAEKWVAALPRHARLALEYTATNVEVRPGAVEAGVRDGNTRPHRVQLRLSPCSPAEWARVARSLADEPELLEEVRAGKLPPRLLTLAEAEGLSLVPPRLTALRSACTCGDRRGRCEHVLAVHLAFARQLASEPWALLIARGARADELVELIDRIHVPEQQSASSEAVARKPSDDPFAKPEAPEPLWSLLDLPRPETLPLASPEGWSGGEAFDAMVTRVITRAVG